MGTREHLARFAVAITPTAEERSEADRQSAYIRARLKNKAARDGSYQLARVLEVGSHPKRTMLRASGRKAFVLDLAACYRGPGATKPNLPGLLQFTRDELRAIYPTKPAGDFVVSRNAVRVRFRGRAALNVDVPAATCLQCGRGPHYSTGSPIRVRFREGARLDVNVVPVIEDDTLGADGACWVPSADGWRLTCVTRHNEFIATRTAAAGGRPGPVTFPRLVRVVKWWNSQQHDLAQPSILCDCLTAKAFSEVGATDQWPTSLLGIFRFLQEHAFAEPIVFGDYYDPETVALPNDPVVILDCANPLNNLASGWSGATREAYLGCIERSYDLMLRASINEFDGEERAALECWCDVFGHEFRSLSE